MAVTTEPKGNLVTPVAFNPDGDIVPFNVDADGNLLVSGIAAENGGGEGASDTIYDDDLDTKIETQRTEDDDHLWFVTAGNDVMTIHDDGIVDFLNQSACGVYLDGDDQSINDDNDTRIAMNAAFFDIHSEFDIVTTRRFTATSGGIYLATLMINLGSLPDAVYAAAKIRVNGATKAATQFAHGKTSNFNISAVLTYALDANDYIEPYVRQEGTGNIDLLAGSNRTNLFISKLH